MEWIASALLFCGVFAIWITMMQMQSRLERSERKLNALLRHLNIESTGQPLSERVKELALDPSRKVQAIKVYREETGASLAEAKAAVEDFIHSK